MSLCRGATHIIKSPVRRRCESEHEEPDSGKRNTPITIGRVTARPASPRPLLAPAAHAPRCTPPAASSLPLLLTCSLPLLLYVTSNGPFIFILDVMIFIDFLFPFPYSAAQRCIRMSVFRLAERIGTYVQENLGKLCDMRYLCLYLSLSLLPVDPSVRVYLSI